MLRSLYAGISGLRSHQTMLDVTGNNIANVNTAAFKSSGVQFQDTMSQLTQGAGAPQAGVGGTNPSQVGLGVQVAGISTNFTQGAPQPTGRATDLMISGEGFFVTQLGNETLYTRAGSFTFDSSGRLAAPDGSIVQGWGAVNGVVADGGGLGDIALPLDATAPAVKTTTATVGGNLPSDAADATVLVRDVQVFDDSGEARTLKLEFTFDSSVPEWNVNAEDDNGNTANTSLTFAAGAQAPAAANLVVGVGGISVDLAAITGFAELTTVSINDQDGRDAGTLDSFTLGKDGTLVGAFSNGASQAIGRIVLATFINPGGLEKAGSSSYRTTLNSGVAEVGAPGSVGLGVVNSGALEMSNVDLSQEFTNLIVAQRGFQANARIITTSDEVLQELTNLKR